MKTLTGRVWKFGDNINTDLMLPGSLSYASEEEQKRGVFAANRPGWVDQVAAGDFIVGGRNYGIGSSRPAARSLRNLGLGCLLAETINGLFFRNAVNWGFLALECPGVHAAVEEGHVASLSLADWTVRNQQTGAELKVTSIPEGLLSIVFGGGVFPILEAQGGLSRETLGERHKLAKAAAPAAD